MARCTSMYLGLLVAAVYIAVTCTSPCGTNCERRVVQLMEQRAKNPVVQLDSEGYKSLLRTAPRNYSTILVLNALDPKRQCKPCGVAAREFKVLATSYLRQYGNDANDLFFASVDFDGGDEVFRKLQCQSAPVFFYVPPKGSVAKSPQQMIMAEDVNKFIRASTSIEISIYRPPNYVKLGIFGTALFLSLFGAYMAWPHVKATLCNPLLWSILSILLSCVMMSGFMWLQIRGSPPNPPGEFISDSSSTMYVSEMYIISSLIGIVTLGLIVLNETASMSGLKLRVFAYGSLALVAVGFSFHYQIFRTKYQGYPYRLLF